MVTKREAPSAEDQAALKQIMGRLELLGPVIAKIKRKCKGQDAVGHIDCPVCKKPEALAFQHHAYNGHVWLRCHTPGCVAMME